MLQNNVLDLNNLQRFSHQTPLHCSESYHPGPYLEMPKIMHGGLFNQWGAFHSDLYAAFLWTNETGGTIIMPTFAYKRASFAEQVPSWQNIEIQKLFDVHFLVKNFQQKDVKICLPKTQQWIDEHKHQHSYIFLSRYPSIEPQHTWDPERLLNRTYEELKNRPHLSLQNRYYISIHMY